MTKSSATAATLSIASLAMAFSLATSGPVAAQVIPTNAAAPNCNAAPNAASQVGYCTKTFATDNFTTANIDMQSTNQPTATSGYQWRPFNCFGVSPSTKNVAISADGVVQVGVGGANYGPTLSTVGCYYGPTGKTQWVGEAFGGGAFIDADIRIVNPHSIPTTNTWPAWWVYSMEALVGSDQWPNQANQHLVGFPEIDIIEYFEGKWNNSLNAFQSTIHAWNGMNTAPLADTNGYKTTFVPSASFFNSWHHYAVRWVPATPTSVGMIDYFVDGQLTFSQTYTDLTTQIKPVAGQPWMMGITDHGHLALFVSSSNEEPIRINNVHVWQKDASEDLVS